MLIERAQPPAPAPFLIGSIEMDRTGEGEGEAAFGNPADSRLLSWVRWNAWVCLLISAPIRLILEFHFGRALKG